MPIIGLLFSISNRVGAAMWAFDLEKRQHAIRDGEEKPLPPRVVELGDGTTVELGPAMVNLGEESEGSVMAGSWVDAASEADELVGGTYVPGEGVVATKKEL